MTNASRRNRAVPATQLSSAVASSGDTTLQAERAGSTFYITSVLIQHKDESETTTPVNVKLYSGSTQILEVHCNAIDAGLFATFPPDTELEVTDGNALKNNLSAAVSVTYSIQGYWQ